MAYAAMAQGKHPSIYVAKSWHSTFAGNHGSNLKQAEKDFGVKIKMPGRETGECGIVIEGEKDKIEEARLHFQKLLGFQIGNAPLALERIQLMPLEVTSITSDHAAFMKIVQKYGVGVLFGNQHNGNIALIQGRSMDIKLVIKEFEKIIQRQIDIIGDNNVNSAANTPHSTAKSDESKNDHGSSQRHGKNNKLTNFRSKLNLHGGNFNEVLFFSPTDEDDCEDFERFLEIIQSATKTLDICIFTLTDNRIRNVLAREFREGVKVRIITDNSQALSLGSDVKYLNEIGIPVKCDYDITEESHMHHKFAVIDKKIALTGSFNWTRSASDKNYENICILSNKTIVNDYSNYFDTLWNHDKGIVDINKFLKDYKPRAHGSKFHQ